MYKIYDHKLIIGILVDRQFEEFDLQVVEFVWRGILKGKERLPKAFPFRTSGCLQG